MSPAPQIVLELVESFGRYSQAYHQATYKEAQVRQSFINPLFHALGWDMDNHAHLPPDQQEVIHEDAIAIEGNYRAPDYAFRVGSRRKFFVEAKKPSVNIQESAAAAYQVRAYAWNCQLPLSIVTDFEEFSVYDCHYPPNATDGPLVARHRYFRYQEYAEQWDELAAIYSREAVFSGAYDEYAKRIEDKRRTLPVDAAFLRDMERWRALLAADLAARNPGLTVRELNYAVQQTLDRIVFLRIAEGRGIEPEDTLKNAAQGLDVYGRLKALFVRADGRYNSGLFHLSKEKNRPEPDTLTPRLSMGDETLAEIIRCLYFPHSPYQFDVLAVEILGAVYEQFLGSVIHLTPEHKAEVEQKPEVRKAGGVYYTPQYIVDYIVQHTVGELVKRKSPGAVSKLRFLDPACGSGSFLLGAYQFLLDWHLKWYATHKPETRTREVYRGPKEAWFLTAEEKKRILLNNLYGVDIDAQAVEVTKLSLLLKVLEGESRESLAQQLSLWGQRALPDLGANIQCGNSLIGPDYMQQGSLLNDDELYRVNPFDWAAAFPETIGAGGFDAVIGNPPYVKIQAMKEWAPLEVEWYKGRYTAASKGNYDIYVVFVEKGLSLLNENGRLGFILPHKFFQAQFGAGLRGLLATQRAVSQVVGFGQNQVFANATTYTCLLFLDRDKTKKHFGYVSASGELDPSALLIALTNQSGTDDQRIESCELPIEALDGSEWNFRAGPKQMAMAKLAAAGIPLGNLTRKIFVGIQTSADQVYVLDTVEELDTCFRLRSKALDKDIYMEKGLVKPFLLGKDIHRYEYARSSHHVVFPYLIEGNRATLMDEAYIQRQFPLGWEYLREAKPILEAREKGRFKGPQWYQYGRLNNLTEFEVRKVMTPDIAHGPQMTYDPDGRLYHTTTIYSFVFSQDVQEDQKYFLGILNSRIIWFYLVNTGSVLRGGYFRFKTAYLNPFPIRTIDFSSPAEVARHDALVALVECMLDLHRRQPAAETPQARSLLERQIAATDAQIDKLVYALYDLTPEEIVLVEGAG